MISLRPNHGRDTLRTILCTIVWTGVAGLAAYSWAAESPLLWVEGESAARSQLHRNAWFDAVVPAELSGGGQIADFSEPDQSEGWAVYDLTVPAAGSYHFWLRANPCTGMAFRVGGNAWTRLDPQALEKEDRANQRPFGTLKSDSMSP